MMDNLKNAQKNMLNKTQSYIPDSAEYYDMIVFCHLRWQFVYQRPQHIISQMAKKMKILFVEEPLNYDEDENSGNLIIVDKMLHVLQPNVQSTQSIASIISKYVANKIIPVGWFYSPSFSPLLKSVQFETVVYDSVDDLLAL